jgi:hypothetical protein
LLLTKQIYFIMKKYLFILFAIVLGLCRMQAPDQENLLIESKVNICSHHQSRNLNRRNYEDKHNAVVAPADSGYKCQSGLLSPLAMLMFNR